MMVSLKGLRGTVPTLAGRLGGEGAFALCARGGGDRLQCSLRPNPAAAVGWGHRWGMRGFLVRVSFLGVL